MRNLAAVLFLLQASSQIQNAPSTLFGMADVLAKHALWMRTNGAEGAKADLREISLEAGQAGQAGVLVGRTALPGVDLRQADFRRATLRNVDFTSANLQDTRFDGANLRWAILANANLRRANFSDANLREVDLRNANLDHTIFHQADLSGADLTNSKCVTKAQLTNAIIDARTKLPEFGNCSRADLPE